MSPLLRNIFAPILGVVLGTIANVGMLMIGPSIVSLPEGVSSIDPESLKANIHLLEARNFILPFFIAHVGGTLVGAFIAAKIAATHKMMYAIAVGVFFLVGGIMNNMDIGGPTWFIVLDLVVAYIPMGYLGGKLASK